MKAAICAGGAVRVSSQGNVRAGQKVKIFYHFNSLRLDVYVLITFALQVMHLGDWFFFP